MVAIGTLGSTCQPLCYRGSTYPSPHFALTHGSLVSEFLTSGRTHSHCQGYDKLNRNSFKSWVGATALALTAFAMLALAPAQFGGSQDASAKGKPGSQLVAATITLNQATPSLGDVVTFSYTGVTDDCGKNYGPRCLRIELVCSQAGTPVYVGDAEASQQFLLGGGVSQWVTNGGPADCTAMLYYYSSYNPVTRVDLANTPFSAAG